MSYEDYTRFKQNLEDASQKIAEISQQTFKTETRYYCKRGDHYLSLRETSQDRNGKLRCPIHKRQVQTRRQSKAVKMGTKTVSGTLALCYKRLGECGDQCFSDFTGRLRVFCVAEVPCWRVEK